MTVLIIALILILALVLSEILVPDNNDKDDYNDE